MDKEFTRMWHVIRHDQGLQWLDWIGEPMLYDGGLFVNRSVEEHNYTSLMLRKI